MHNANVLCKICLKLDCKLQCGDYGRGRYWENIAEEIKRRRDKLTRKAHNLMYQGIHMDTVNVQYTVRIGVRL